MVERRIENPCVSGSIPFRNTHNLCMYLLILALPLFAFATVLCFGRYIGHRGASVLTLLTMTIASILAFIALYEVGIQVGVKQIYLADWLPYDASWGLLFDSLTVVMLSVVTLISTCVHLYSLSYMQGDPHLPRFLSYLSLFTFFMLILVSADNLVQMFVGWEGVALASFVLINFWHTRIQANKSAIKALLVNRVGDFALALGIFTTYLHFHSVQYTTVFQAVSADSYVSDSIPILLFIGAMGKSAQLGLHTWLPDAMEGPTPVSALIHAATMVTAGVFLVARCSPLFESARYALSVVTCVGGITAIFAASIGVLQNDIKRVIAYSTCSQLGYMFFACGLSHYSVAIFHLVNHAFFKAVLFLSAGALIHALSDEQDMRKMGGLTRSLPFTYACMLLGSLSLAGTPFLAGYYSKDSIIELAYTRYGELAHAVYLLGTLTAFLTAWYSFRMHALVFYRKAHSYTELSVGAPTHEAKASMVIPLCVLALASIFSGYILKDSMVGIGTHFWCNLPAYTSNAQHTYICDSEFAYQDGYTLVDSFAPWLPIILSILGAILGSLMPTHISANALASYLYTIRLPQVYSGVIRFITQRWLYDKITNDIFARTSMVFAYHVSFKTLDKGFITIFGPYGIPRVLTQLASSLRNLQSGMIYHYAFIMVIALMHAITQVCGIAGYTSATPVYVKLLLMCVLIYLLESKRPYATHAHA